MTIPGGFSSGDVLTAADMNGLPAGIVGDSSTTTPYTLTGTLADIPGLSFTFNAVTGRLYRFLFYCGSTDNQAVGTFRANIKLDLSGTVIQNGYFGSLTYGYPYLIIGLWTPGTPAAGSVTAKARGYRDQGASGGYLYADAVTPMQFFCEDIGEA